MARIKIENVAKSFKKPGSGGLFGRTEVGADDVTAIRSLSLDVADQEFFAVVGPSGCGKSTVLNLLAGLEYPDSGEIYFDDQPVSRLPARERDVALVFQSYALYPHMSVRDNIAFPLRVRKIARRKIQQDVEEVAAALGLTELLSRRPKNLSGGQRQRVALARALVRRPRVFLMDEPLSNLDARLRIDTRGEIKRLHQRWKITTVYVTHDQEEAMVLADRMVVLRGGEIQQCGTPREIFEKPRNLFTAEFIGLPPMNIIPTDILPAVLVKSEERRPVCGVRPSDLAASPNSAAPSSAELSLQGRIEDIFDTGADVWVSLNLGSALLKARWTADTAPALGQSVTATVGVEKLHLFDANSGLRRCA